jgi:ribosomal protein S18 acetylase RimI-like enzyme
MDAQLLPRERFGEAELVIADAFIDDPGWVAVGPNDRRRRHGYIRRVGRGILRIVDRFGGPIWCVERDGRLAGVLSTLDPGQWPPPAVRSLAYQAPGPIPCGPAVLWRSLQADNALHKGHPDEPHVFIWTLTVAPEFQRRGVGRAMMAAAFERAAQLGVSSYLDTANPDNLPYYRSLGFEETGEHPLPRGANVWFMYRGMR